MSVCELHVALPLLFLKRWIRSSFIDDVRSIYRGLRPTGRPFTDIARGGEVGWAGATHNLVHI